MSNNPENHAADGSAAKKRKRKRSKKVQQEKLEPVFVEDVRVNRTNKKTKFDQDEQDEAKEFTSSEQNNDALTIKEKGTLRFVGGNRDSESNEANTQERLEVEEPLTEDKHHLPSKIDRLKPKKAGSVKKKTIFLMARMRMTRMKMMKRGGPSESHKAFHVVPWRKSSRNC
ncbi:hypothetical protein OXX79_012929 [Metschnikowia pulcherrima]